MNENSIPIDNRTLPILYTFYKIEILYSIDVYDI